MEVHEGIHEEKVKKEKKRIKRSFQEESIQYNRQDLDQEQKVDVNPLQFNTQNVQILVGHDKDFFAGKITGTTYLSKNKNIAPNARIYLYFGPESRFPVHTTNSDGNGCFVIEDLPPGYYTIVAELGDLKYHSHYIKVLPGHKIHESVLLSL